MEVRGLFPIFEEKVCHWRVWVLNDSGQLRGTVTQDTELERHARGKRGRQITPGRDSTMRDKLLLSQPRRHLPMDVGHVSR